MELLEVESSDGGNESGILSSKATRNGDQEIPDIKSIGADRAKVLKEKLRRNGGLLYSVEDKPPWHATILLALQHYLGMFSYILITPIILAPLLCIEGDIEIISKLVASTFLVTALQTFIQATFGVRLPIVQGPSLVYVLPLFTLISLRQDCPVVGESVNGTILTREDARKEFLNRIQEFQGGALLGCIFELFVGFSGLIGLLLGKIGPLTIGSTIGLIGLSLFDFVTTQASTHWGISGLTVVLILMFSEYIDRFQIPFPGFTRAKGLHAVRYPVFKAFPIFLAITISWLFCYILTVTNVFPDDPSESGYLARTDIRIADLANTSWFYAPYPGQWGSLKVTAGGVLGIIAATVASITESLGDYYACARLSGAPPPPIHALNRGIGIEGLGGMISAAWGCGSLSTSYSNNIGIVGITKVGSRLVIQVLSVIFFLCAFVLKLGAFFAIIPEPVIGGVIVVGMAMVAAVGFSTLQYADMNSTRNLTLVGITLYIGLAVPSYVSSNPGIINTGSEAGDQILQVMLTTSMFIGAVVGFLLDNTMPGTMEERGIVKYWQLVDEEDDDDEEKYDAETEIRIKYEVSQIVNSCYDPPIGMEVIRRCSWTRYIPFSPTFKGFNCGHLIPKTIRRRFRQRAEKNGST